MSRLREKLKANIAVEIMAGVGLAGGGAIISLWPYFWAVNTTKGAATIGVGLLLIVGATVGKVVQVKK